MNLKQLLKTRKRDLNQIEKNSRNWKTNKKIMLSLMLLIIIMVFFSGISFGKAIHNTLLKNHVEIAKPILEVEKNSEIMITETNRKGEYEFKVKNYNDIEEISQVDLKYYIEILEENLDKSIQFELYRENEKIELQNNKTTEIKLNKDTKEEHTYTLKIEYNSDKNTVGDILKDIQIKVHSEQVKI